MTLLGLILLVLGLIFALKVLVWIGGILLVVGLCFFLFSLAGDGRRHIW